MHCISAFPTPAATTVVCLEVQAPTIEANSDGLTITASFALPTSSCDHELQLVEWANDPFPVGDPVPVSASGDRTFEPQISGYYRVGLTACPPSGNGSCGETRYSTQSVRKLPLPSVIIDPRSAVIANYYWTIDSAAESAKHRHREPGGTWQNWPIPFMPWPLVLFAELVGHGSHEYEVTAIADTSNGFLLHSEPLEFVVIDNPSAQANGANGKIELLFDPWLPHGTSFAYAGGEVRYRQLQPHNGVRHDSTDETSPWSLSNYGDAEVVSVPSVSVRSVTLDDPGKITKNEVYALQVNYWVETFESQSGDLGRRLKVFSGRDVYAWPSDDPADDGERVATFPLDNTFDGKYEYHFCHDTFPGPDSVRDKWETLAIEALSSWQRATDNLVTVTQLSRDCLDYSRFVNPIAEIIAEGLSATNPLTAEENEIIEDVLESFTDNLIADDKAKSEVSMLDDEDVVKEPGQFWALSGDIGKWAFCESLLTGTASGCAPGWRNPSTGEYVSVDIILRRSAVNTTSLDVPAIYASRCNPHPVKPYSTFAHEGGHALGIRGGQTDTGQGMHHLWVTDSIMVNGVLCDPTPLDVLAMYAIYQGVD